MELASSSPQPGPSTTARARSSGACSSTASRSSRTSSRRSSARAARSGFDYTNLALLTDGLRAEREQGITIDVAYRYFATPKRKFIIADTPGHVQYTRNMVTGASTADLAMILVDARKGVLEQTRRHAVIASLLQVRHLVLCVNKMDLVDFDEQTFDRISRGVHRLRREARRSRTSRSSRSRRCTATTSPSTPPTRRGTTARRCSHHLEHVYIGSDRNLIDSRFPVQWVDPADVERVPRLPRLRGRGRGRDLPARRRGDGAAVAVSPRRSRASTCTARSSKRRCRRMSVTIAPRRQPRHQPRRHDLPAEQRADGHPGDRRA